MLVVVDLRNQFSQSIGSQAILHRAVAKQPPSEMNNVFESSKDPKLLHHLCHPITCTTDNISLQSKIVLIRYEMFFTFQIQKERIWENRLQRWIDQRSSEFSSDSIDLIDLTLSSQRGEPVWFITDSLFPEGAPLLASL